MAGSVVKPKNGTGTHPQAMTSAHALRLEVYGALLTLLPRWCPRYAKWLPSASGIGLAWTADGYLV